MENATRRAWRCSRCDVIFDGAPPHLVGARITSADGLGMGGGEPAPWDALQACPGCGALLLVDHLEPAEPGSGLPASGLSPRQRVRQALQDPDFDPGDKVQLALWEVWMANHTDEGRDELTKEVLEKLVDVLPHSATLGVVRAEFLRQLERYDESLAALRANDARGEAAGIWTDRIRERAEARDREPFLLQDDRQPRREDDVRGTILSSDELIFWIEWYRDLQTVMEKGRGSVRLEPNYHSYDRFTDAFAPAVLALAGLVDRLIEPGPPRGRDNAWPAPALPENAAHQLVAWVRQPLELVNRDPLEASWQPGSPNPVSALFELFDLVKAMAERDNSCGAYIAAFDAARQAFDFLSEKGLHETLGAFGMDSSALVPFAQWVSTRLTLESWIQTDVEPDDWTDVEDSVPSDNTYVCDHCGYEASDLDHQDFCDGSGNDMG